MIEKLWYLLPHPPDTVVRWFAKKGQANAGEFAESPKVLERAAKQYGDWDFYVMPNPTRERCGIRVSADDIIAWSWMFIDVDPVEKEYKANLALDEALLWLCEWVGYNITPTIIDSGRGQQAWIRLIDTDVLDRPQWRSESRQAMSYWLKKLDKRIGLNHGCKIDTSCCDLPRVMRCPGTVNQKSKKRAKILQVGDVHPGLAYRLITGTPPEVLTPPPVQVAPEGTAWQMAYPRLTNRARQFIDNGQSEPGRHQAAMATAYSLRDAGIDRVQTLAALEQGNARSVPPLSPGDLERILKNAYKNVVPLP